MMHVLSPGIVSLSPTAGGINNPLIAVSEWPSASITYNFEGDGIADPVFTISFAFSTDRYTAGDLSAKNNAIADLAVWLRVWFLLTDAATTDIYYTLSLLGSKDTPEGQPQQIDTLNLRSHFVRPVINYLYIIANGNTPPSPPLLYDAITLTVPIDSIAFYSYLLPLSVCIGLQRMNPADTDIESVTTAIRNHFEESNETTGGFLKFAERFETAFNHPDSPVVFKIAAATSTDIKLSHTIAPLNVIRFDSTGEKGICITYLRDNHSQTQAYYYAPSPLATTLQSFSTSIAPYESGIPFDASLTGRTIDFQLIDPDSWALQFLEAVDKFFDPVYSVPLLFLDQGDSMMRILNARKKLAEAIADATDYIITPIEEFTSHPASINDAREKWLQKLSTQLSLTYRNTAAVQVPVNISSTWNGTTDDAPFMHAPPRLYGQMKGVPADGIAKPILSEATLQIASGPAWLTYLCENTGTPASAAAFRQMDFTITHFEYDLDPVSSDIYSSPMRLFIVLPEIMPGLLTDTGTVDVPIPLKNGSHSSARILQQSANHPSSTISPDNLIQKARSWDYLFTYTTPEPPQEATELQISVNLQETRPDDATGMPSVVPEIYQSLTQFCSMYPALSADFDAYLVNVQSAASPDVARARNAVDALISMIDIIAIAWQEWNSQVLNATINKKNAAAKMITNATPATTTFNYTVLETFSGEVSTSPLLILISTATQTAFIPLIDIPGYRTNAERRENVTFYSYHDITTGNPLLYVDRKSAPIRNMSFGPLDLLNIRSVQGGLQVKGNHYLLPMPGKSTEWQQTNPWFIFNGPITKFATVYKPAFNNADAIDISKLLLPYTGKRTLVSYMSALFAALTVNVNDSLIPIQVKCDYQYTLNVDLPVTLPVFVSSQFKLMIADKGANCASMMNDEMIRWLNNVSPDTNMAQWNIGVQLFSPLSNEYPVLDISCYLSIAVVE